VIAGLSMCVAMLFCSYHWVKASIAGRQSGCRVWWSFWWCSSLGGGRLLVVWFHRMA
jgi:hypothetical protein